MKILKTIWTWIRSNIPILNTILMVIIIAQLMSYFDIKLINTTIMPVAYLVSIFLIFLTLKEHKIRNKMEIGRDIVEHYKTEMTQIIKTHNESNNKDYKFEFTSQNRTIIINPTNFTTLYTKIIKIIFMLEFDTVLGPYYERLKLKDSTLLNNSDNELKTTNDNLANIHSIIFLIYLIMFDLSKVLIRLEREKDMVEKSQIKLILREFDQKTKYFHSFFEDQESKKFLNQIFYINESKRLSDNVMGNLSAIISNKKYENVFPSMMEDLFFKIEEQKKELLK
jgi:hypothetical protein